VTRDIIVMEPVIALERSKLRLGGGSFSGAESDTQIPRLMTVKDRALSMVWQRRYSVDYAQVLLTFLSRA